MKKICVVTGTRAEYGLLYWLMKEISDDTELCLQIIVTGMHLSPEFGLTYKEIEKEFRIDKKIEMLLSSDTSIGVSKSMGLAQISFSEAYEELKPDILVVLGDRYEIFSAVAASMISRIPVAHIHGGEATEGLIDESIRHSITKMSHLHFTATDRYMKRVIQLGENPQRVFNVGGMGIDNINKLDLLSRNDFEKSIDFKLNKKNIMITFHPVTLEKTTAKNQFQELLYALEALQDTNIIFTKANSDVDGRVINEMIDEYVAVNTANSIAFKSLGQVRYLSALKYVDVVVGNSSSGLIEAPSFKVGVINIGDRQKGRVKASCVIDCDPAKEKIVKAFCKVYSSEFRKVISNTTNPYGSGGASTKVKNTLKDTNTTNLLKKIFHDIRND